MKFTYLLLFCFLWLGSCTTSPEEPPLTGLKLMSEEQKTEMSFSLNAKIPAYTEDGEIIKKSEWPLYMNNSKFSKDIYLDSANVIKAVVFKKKKNIEKQKPSIITPTVQAHKTGYPAPDFEAVDMEGNPISLSILKGKVVVLNFWFIACKPCVMEMPDLNALKERYNEKDVMFIGVTFDKKEAVHNFLKTKNFHYKIIPDGKDICEKWGITSFPTNVVIDKGGIIQFEEYGLKEDIYSVLNKRIAALL